MRVRVRGWPLLRRVRERGGERQRESGAASAGIRYVVAGRSAAAGAGQAGLQITAEVCRPDRQPTGSIPCLCN